MELVLSAISAGGLVGAANQYACLLILAITARLGWITITPSMNFMTSLWFIGIVLVFWIITLAPAYASLLAPGVMNAIHTISNFLSGFIVPLSSALLSLASVGVIATLNPEMKNIIETLRIFNPDGSLGAMAFAVAGAGGGAGTALTAMKALAKPGISASSGTTGHAAAPIYATLENIMALVLMAAAYFLSKIDPWLLVALTAGVALILFGLLIFALIQLYRLKKGIGKVFDLLHTNPKAGLAIVCDFLIWGSGWLAWKSWARGFIMLIIWAGWLFIFFIVQPLFVGLFAFIQPVLPFVGTASIVLLIMSYFAIGLGSARALLRTIEKDLPSANYPEQQDIPKQKRGDKMSDPHNSEILFYATSWCPDCRRAKTVLDQHKAIYRFIDIDKDAEGRQYVEKVNHGNRSVPTIVFPDGSILVEPSNAQITEKLG